MHLSAESLSGNFDFQVYSRKEVFFNKWRWLVATTFREAFKKAGISYQPPGQDQAQEKGQEPPRKRRRGKSHGELRLEIRRLKAENEVLIGIIRRLK